MPDYEEARTQQELCDAKLVLAAKARHESDKFMELANKCAEIGDTTCEAQNLTAAINKLQEATDRALEAQQASDAAKAALEE